MLRTAGLIALFLGLLTGMVAADPARPLAGLSIGHATAPISDDDAFSGRLISGYAGARLSSSTALALRVHHTSDSVSDPFDQVDDRYDRYLHALPTLRLGATAWIELGAGFTYRWREYGSGERDDGMIPAFHLAVGVAPGAADWVVRPELSIGVLSSVGAFASVGLRFQLVE